ncbi:TMM54 protein, partial [Spizella passerina]|nr:TMM54 protein [Spizella passerina]
MKTGLILLIVGHLIFISGALVHGSALRFVLSARDSTALHYGVTNSAAGIAALL